MKAEIDWRSSTEGGRKAPPSGDGPPHYATIIRFADTDEPWPPAVAWTLVVEKLNVDNSNPLRWIADVRFRVDEAPHDELYPGRVFSLYEGKKCVATGKVL